MTNQSQKEENKKEEVLFNSDGEPHCGFIKCMLRLCTDCIVTNATKNA